MNEITDEYRQQVIGKLLAAEGVANVSEQRDTNKPGATQQKRVDGSDNDPIAQVMQNKLEMERQEDEGMDEERIILTENVNMDIISSLIK